MAIMVMLSRDLIASLRRESMCEHDDNDYSEDDGDVKNVEGDIYIMMQCVFVCHEKSSLPTSELGARGAK